MKLGDWATSQQEAVDPILSPDRMVWVVTVHAETAYMAPPQSKIPPTASVYTTVTDAATGDVIEKAIGVDYVK